MKLVEAKDIPTPSNPTGSEHRRGEKGEEGDGKLNPGDPRTISDVVTINLDSSAKDLGDQAFAKLADPKIAFLKPFLKRINKRWKANLMARTRTRLEIG